MTSPIVTNGEVNGLQRCVSLAQGTISPDMRVNYTYGLVMDVDAFVQEQTYFLHKEYTHNRGLHGYGTVSGLRVRVEPEDPEGTDYEITVEPGIGIDQCGRTFIVRYDQCAQLNAWLARQAQSDNIDGLPAESGTHRVYVVATHDECEDALVSIAGEPCGPSGSLTAPSRIRDTFNITLAWQRPAMPAWDTILCFADLLQRVRVIPSLERADSDIGALLEFLSGITAPETIEDADICDQIATWVEERAEAGENPYLQIGESTAREDLDDVLRIWITYLRPMLDPDLLSCDPSTVNTGVVLGHLDLNLIVADGSLTLNTDGEVPAVVIGDNERPYLLSTQVIQELLLLGGGGETAETHTLGSITVPDSRSVLLWLHLPQEIGEPEIEDLSELVQVSSNNNRLTVTDFVDAGLPNTYRIVVEEQIPANARVEVTLNLRRFTFTADDEEQNLFNIINNLPFEFIGQEDDALILRTFADALPDVLPFVTIRTFGNGSPGRMELWFHMPENTELVPQDRDINDIVEVRRDGTVIQISSMQTNNVNGQVIWNLNFRAQFSDGNHLSVRFEASNLFLTIGQGERSSLLDWMQNTQTAYLGYDGGTTIVAYHTHVVDLVGEGGGGISEDEVRVIVNRAIESVRTLPFVTPRIMGIGANRQNVVFDFELWFHPAVEIHSDGNGVEITAFDNEILFPIYPFFEVPFSGAVIPGQIVELQQINQRLYRAQCHFPIDSEINDVEFGDRRHFRFAFDLDSEGDGGIRIENALGSFDSIRDYIQATNTKLDGFITITDTEALGQRETLVTYVSLSIAEIRAIG